MEITHLIIQLSAFALHAVEATMPQSLNLSCSISGTHQLPADSSIANVLFYKNTPTCFLLSPKEYTRTCTRADS